VTRSVSLILAGLGCAGLAVVGWQGGSSASTTTSNATRTVLTGADLFQAKGCAQCHVGPATQPLVAEGPPLDDAPSWAATRVPDLTAEEYLDQSIRDPSVFRPPLARSGTVMPGLVVSDSEIDALVDYLLQG
jgi:mono/diheme cytochrome c family protein